MISCICQVSFEDIEKSMAQLLDLCQRTLFDWSRCWGLSDCSTIIDFLLSLRMRFWFLYFFLLLCCSLFTTVNFVYLLLFSINNITFLPIKKKKEAYVKFLWIWYTSKDVAICASIYNKALELSKRHLVHTTCLWYIIFK